MPPVEVVISGIGGLLPACKDVDEFWGHLMSGEPLASSDNLRWPPGECEGQGGQGTFCTFNALLLPLCCVQTIALSATVL